MIFHNASYAMNGKIPVNSGFLRFLSKCAQRRQENLHFLKLHGGRVSVVVGGDFVQQRQKQHSGVRIKPTACTKSSSCSCIISNPKKAQMQLPERGHNAVPVAMPSRPATLVISK